MKTSIPILYTIFSKEITDKFPYLIEEVSIPPNEYIFHQNSYEDKAIYIIAKGVVELSLGFGKNKLILGRLKKGNSFGLISFFSN